MADQGPDHPPIGSSSAEIANPESRVSQSRKQTLSLLMGFLTMQAGVNQIVSALTELVALEESDRS